MPYGTHKTQAAMNKAMLVSQWHEMKAQAASIGRGDLVEKYPLPDGGLKKVDKVTCAFYRELQAAINSAERHLTGR